LLDDALSAAAAQAAAGFPLRVPASFVRRMRPRDPRDPLLLQVLPLGREQQTVPGFGGDPLGEAQARRAPSLLQKYAGRALLVATGACAVHCRYCFRRDFDYGEDASLEAAIAAIAGDPSIEEVILSGGDPLVLSDRRLGSLIREARGIAHVRRLRIHTRTPIVLPSRVDDGLIAALGEGDARRAPLALVLHANHPAEIDDEVRTAIGRLRDTGATLLNQSVLLRDVNDDVAVLRALSDALYTAGVLPYYLHLLDPVAGVAHFDVPETRARELVQGLLAVLPGYLVPRLVREESGMPNKTWLNLGPASQSAARSPG
jgi:EF-P beta-lysylation protein EpmB